MQFTLVSLDPARDRPEVLKRYMLEHDLDENLWTMLNGDPDDVLELSALLGVRYKPMDSESKDIAHSNMITVLDRQGRIHYQMKGLNQDLDLLMSWTPFVLSPSYFVLSESITGLFERPRLVLRQH